MDGIVNSEKLEELLEIKDISLLYDRIMKGYSDFGSEASFGLIANGCCSELYAPGYDKNGVAEVVAKCV